MSEMNMTPGEVNGVPEKPQKAKKSRKKLIITLSIVGAVLIAGAVTAAVLLNTPKALVARAFANSAKALQQNKAVALMKNTSENGSVGVSLGLGEILEEQYGTYIDGRVDMKLYNGKSHRAVEAGIAFDGETFADVTILNSETDLVVTSEALFGDGAYGFNMNEASEAFRTSVFGPNGEYSLGIESIDQILDVLRVNADLEEDVNTLMKEGSEVLLKSLDKNAETGKEDESIDFNGDSVKVTAVEFKLDDDAIRAVLEDMIDYMEDSDSLANILETYDELSNSGDDYYYYSYADGFYEELDYLKDSLDEIDNSTKVTVTFYITKSGTQLVGIGLDVSASGEKVGFTLLAGPDLAKVEEIRVEIDTAYNDGYIAYQVDEDNDSRYSATLMVATDEERMELGYVEWNKKSGDIELVAKREDGTEVFSLIGNLKADDNRASFALENIRGLNEYYDYWEDTYVSQYEEISLDLTVTLNAADSIPSMPGSYTDIFAMTTADVENLVMEVGMNMVMKYYTLDDDVLMLLENLLYGMGM